MYSAINILIAEDEENIALALKTIITKAIGGASITIVKDGDSALDAAFRTTFQLIISDWNMPGMTGINLLTVLRDSETTKNIPFLMVTAREDMPSVMSALESGVTGYLTKPFENQIVIDRITQMLGMASKRIEDSI